MARFSKLFNSPEAYILKGNRIREMREARGMTQEDLAKKLKVSRKTVGHYEAGMSPKKLASLDTWERLAMAFSRPGCKVTVALLLDLTD